VSDSYVPVAVPAPGGEVTRLLAAARGGDPGAAERVFDLVYDDMRQLAARHVRSARAGPGPSPTSLVHEAFLRLARRADLPFNDRAHFFAVISRAMRQIVIDDALARKTGKRGGGQPVADLEKVAVASPAPEAPPEDLLALDAALATLEAEEPRLAQVVEWHFFGGLTFFEIGESLAVSERTVARDWRAARALLHARLATLR
jgi:RNA polymerase sigma factor (TIGR02999 family)